jgi:leucine dehydrogenase
MVNVEPKFLSGKKVLITGAGNGIGKACVIAFIEAGADVLAVDSNADSLADLESQYKIKSMVADLSTPDKYFPNNLEVDIFAPCALGGILNDNTLPKLKCQIIAGGANNQLEDEIIHGNILREKGIIYAPDFVINAGGLINVYSEYNGYVREQAMSQTENIYNTILDIYKMADVHNLNNQQAAIKLAEKRINDMMLVHSTF